MTPAANPALERDASSRRYVRTESGHREVRERHAALSRPGRTLLLLIDASRRAQDWIDDIDGCTERDLQALLQAGLVEPFAAPGPPADPQVDLAQALERWEFQPLYALLTAETRDRFGLFKGFRLVMKLEKCAGIGELRAFALEFGERLRREHGEAAFRHLCRRLSAPDDPG
jgi:hypothetical protein